MLDIKDNKIWFEGKMLGFIAKIEGEMCFVTKKDSDKHFLKKGQGYSLNLEMLNYLEKKCIMFILIQEWSKTYGLRKFVTTVENYKRGTLVKEDGYEHQKVIPLKSMKQL